MDEQVTHAREHADLKRGIGPWLLFAFVLGDIVGAGIYALVGEVGAVIGGAIWVAFLCAFILAIFTAASYAELVTKYPRAGGSATYVNNAFQNSFVSFMVAFAVAAASLTSASVLSLAFSGDYLLQFISVPSVLAALVFVVVIGFINFYGISESVRLNLVFTCVEITGLVLIVVIGFVALGAGTGEPARAVEFKEGASILPAILAGTVLSFYALIGFDDSVNVAEEVRHPSRIYPRAIFGGLLAAVGRNPDALDTLSSTTVVLLLLAFIMVNVSVLALRGDKVEHEHYRTPSVFPILGIVVAASLLIFTAINDLSVLGLAGLLLGIGLILYGVNVLVKRSLGEPLEREE